MSGDLLVEKKKGLEERLENLGRVVIAYSGGVDSALLLKIALDRLGAENVIAVTASSASLAQVERSAAVELAQRLGVRLEIIPTNEFDLKEYRENKGDRCYHCKNVVFGRILAVKEREGFDHVLSGANADDTLDHRPGERAADKLGVIAPLKEAGLTKEEIRTLSRELGLSTWDKPSSPCLASRVPYGSEVTPEKLRQIESGEEVLRREGFYECRVRHHGEVARIELPVESFLRVMEPDVRRRIDSELRALGFTYITLDLRGIRSGSLNDLLQTEKH